MPVAVQSRGSSGETYEITLDATGPEAGRIAIRSWKAGRLHTGAPDSASNYNLYQIYLDDSGALVCKADVAYLPDPVVTCRLDPNPGGSPLVRIWVGLASFVYPVSPDDFDALGRFIRDARFPRR